MCCQQHPKRKRGSSSTRGDGKVKRLREEGEWKEVGMGREEAVEARPAVAYSLASISKSTKLKSNQHINESVHLNQSVHALTRPSLIET